MNAPRTIVWMLLALIGLTCLPIFTASVWAAGESATPVLHASFYLELVSDRTRLIQVSCVIVALGCALIWWYK